MRAKALTAAAALAAAALMAVAGPAVAASAAPTPSPDDVTWSVAPATADGPDGRSWVEQELAPGATFTEHLALRNLGATETTFALDAADGYFTETGRFNMLQAGQTSVAAGTWITVEESVTVAPGATAVVPFTVTVPENATPGDHAAGIAASVSSTGTTSDGAQIGVNSRVGFRVMTQVTGALAPALEVTDATVGYAPSWNLFTPGSLAVGYTAENTGNTQLAFGERVDGAVTDRGDLFPGESRSVIVAPTSAWPIGLITVDVVVESSVPSDPGLAVAPVTQTVTVWAVPWLHLAVLAGIALVIVLLVIGRRRRKAAVERLIAEARAEGRRESAVAR
ncbi:DUF916 domain-containing protein [Herbiconiux sp. CPCC 203407]|uniref:DUF916 domain-containing protein n=1 Tax=Herbiconiux oxytropis TaxID=2970915 RepID=A0AA42BSZ1_9MICO|nr:DUF916 domain-containing protein [Herbiconiux oxytropis]MCS5724116.1 DUF916 domain-containing protein [Herbiconiux oxytropis]MCS5725287.1 DUF916 domain-containing protein [Herbiconiux oxytropis]